MRIHNTRRDKLTDPSVVLFYRFFGCLLLFAKKMLPRIVGYIFPRLETVVDKTQGRDTIGTITAIIEKQTARQCVDELVNILHFVFTWPMIPSSRWHFFPWRPIWSPSAAEKRIRRGGGKAALTDIRRLQLREVLFSGGYGWGKTLEESVTSRLALQLVMGCLNQFRESVRLNSWFQRIGSMIQTFLDDPWNFRNNKANSTFCSLIVFL